MAESNLRNDDNGVDTGDQVKPGGTVKWPSVAEISTFQEQIEDDSRLWLATCRDLARLRLPQSCFESIPLDIWRFRVGGSKVVIMRTPKVEQQGSIIIPGTSQKMNERGWILTVGQFIHNTSEPNVQGREYPYGGLGDFSPLLAVGDLVLFNRHAGQALVSSLIDEGAVHRSQAQQFLLISIADIFGPVVDVDKSDWSPIQEEVFTPTSPTSDTTKGKLIV